MLTTPTLAVLGDAELILPLRRDGDASAVFDRGSIDRRMETKRAAQSILEGGDQAFQRRREIYGGRSGTPLTSGESHREV